MTANKKDKYALIRHKRTKIIHKKMYYVVFFSFICPDTINTMQIPNILEMILLLENKKTSKNNKVN